MLHTFFCAVTICFSAQENTTGKSVQSVQGAAQFINFTSVKKELGAPLSESMKLEEFTFVLKQIL